MILNKALIDKIIISRKIALEKGLNSYFTGEVCKQGHIDVRTTNRGECLSCIKIYRKKNYLKNKKLISEKGKKFRKSKPDIIKARKKKYYTKNKETILLAQKNKNKNKSETQRKKERETNQKYRDKNKKDLKDYRTNWINKNKNSQLEKRKKRRIKKVNKNPQYTLIERLRSRLYTSTKLGGYVKTKNTLSLIGCKPNFFKKYIENQFEDGMDWDNRSNWHIDHIIPINFFQKYFDYSDIRIQKLCWHYSNFQPMWAKNNIAKGSTFSVFIKFKNQNKQINLQERKNNELIELMKFSVNFEIKNIDEGREIVDVPRSLIGYDLSSISIES